MTISEDIQTWAATRPRWQQEVLQALATGNQLDNAAIAALADTLVAGSADDVPPEPMPILMPQATDERVQVARIRDCVGVNALVDGSTLELAETGLTVIYGDNGSGKSGYARLLKALVRAHHSADVLPDVFAEPALNPSATLDYTVDGIEASVQYPGAVSAELRKVSFYDEHCGDAYIRNQSHVTYRPSALKLLDGLIEVCGRTQAVLQDRARDVAQRALQLQLPAGTSAATFVASLTSETTPAAIAAAVAVPEGIEAQLSAAMTEETRLLATDAGKERSRLGQLATHLTQLARHLEGVEQQLGQAAKQAIVRAQAHAAALRRAANVAADATFGSADLPGVGGDTWRALWDAARQYSVTAAYPDHEHPATHTGARCVLCQQVLDENASQRLQRFAQFMSDTTERDAKDAERQLKQLMATTGAAITSASVSAMLLTVSQDHPQTGDAVNAWIEAAQNHQLRLLTWLQDREEPEPQLAPASELMQRLKEAAAKAKTSSENIDVARFQEALQAAQTTKNELKAKILLAESSTLLSEEVARQIQSKALNRALSKVDTSGITRKTTDLMRIHATELLKDRFTRETENLKLRRVTLKDLGGRKGQLTHQPQLLGATHASANANAVLSEGEQTALGLAGFFTEAEFDPSKSALILDDPVTSLDHVRRGYVAKRLAELAHDRQVVVFTHDVAFVADLSAVAEEEGVSLTTRSVERRANEPGHCLSDFPWKAKDFGQRCNELENELARIKKQRSTWTSAEYDEACASWAGRLSEMWERSVSTEILNIVFDRGSSEVRPKKFRLLAAITEQDDLDFQTGYSHCSKWARRHDKAPTTNYVAPEPDDMAAELARIKEWRKRIVNYVK